MSARLAPYHNGTLRSSPHRPLSPAFLCSPYLPLCYQRVLLTTASAAAARCRRCALPCCRPGGASSARASTDPHCQFRVVVPMHRRIPRRARVAAQHTRVERSIARPFAHIRRCRLCCSSQSCTRRRCAATGLRLPAARTVRCTPPPCSRAHLASSSSRGHHAPLCAGNKCKYGQRSARSPQCVPALALHHPHCSVPALPP